LRHVVLLDDPAGKRAQETGSAERTLFRKADTETEQSMVSLTPRKQPLRDLREAFRNGQPEG
jgi:hypothetical protein